MTLDEIRKVVVTNNRSTLSDDVVICQIYMESRFDPKAGATHSAHGLMQMQLNAVKQVFKYRKQKSLGRKTSDKETAIAFAKGAAMHKSPSIFDAASEGGVNSMMPFQRRLATSLFKALVTLSEM